MSYQSSYNVYQTLCVTIHNPFIDSVDHLTGLCTIRARVDYKGGDISSISIASGGLASNGLAGSNLAGSITAIEGGGGGGGEGGGGGGGVNSVWDKALCCQRCQQTPNCKHFTIDPEGGICYLKHSKGTEVASEAWDKTLLSGDVV